MMEASMDGVSAMATVTNPMTLDEFLKLPEEEVALEFADGEVTQKVAPRGQHSRLQLAIAKMLDDFANPPKIAAAFTELRSTFASVSRVPDVSVYRWERIPVDSEGRVANDFFEPPDLLVEIVSPEQRINTLIRRCLWFVAHGVRIALLVDPDDESIVVFRPNTIPQPLVGDDRIAIDEVLPGFKLTVAELFATLQLR
jgi:Uma2 family endonuclease